jgi:predicted ATP-dependent serine protease
VSKQAKSKWVCATCRAIYLRPTKLCRRCGCLNLAKKRITAEDSQNSIEKAYNPEDVPREPIKAKPKPTDLDDIIQDILGD